MAKWANPHIHITKSSGGYNNKENTKSGMWCSENCGYDGQVNTNFGSQQSYCVVYEYKVQGCSSLEWPVNPARLLSLSSNGLF